jgi:hypothetical protein
MARKLLITLRSDSGLALQRIFGLDPAVWKTAGFGDAIGAEQFDVVVVITTPEMRASPRLNDFLSYIQMRLPPDGGRCIVI